MTEPVAPAAGAPATAKPATPPEAGLVRRMVNGLEYWMHEESKKLHSAVKAEQTIVPAPFMTADGKPVVVKPDGTPVVAAAAVAAPAVVKPDGTPVVAAA